MLLYDGLHYDAMAVAAYPGGAPEDLDVTCLPVGGYQLAHPPTGHPRCLCFWAATTPSSLSHTHPLTPRTRQIGSQQAEAAMEGARSLVRAAHEARQFTDVAGFTLRCGVCQIGVKCVVAAAAAVAGCYFGVLLLQRVVAAAAAAAMTYC